MYMFLKSHTVCDPIIHIFCCGHFLVYCMFCCFGVVFVLYQTFNIADVHGFSYTHSFRSALFIFRKYLNLQQNKN